MKLIWMAGWAAALAITVFMWASEVFAQQGCRPLMQVASVLLSQYNETPESMGLTDDGQFMFQMWRNSESGSWTMIRIDGNAVACVVASGSDWQLIGPIVDGLPTE